MEQQQGPPRTNPLEKSLVEPTVLDIAHTLQGSVQNILAIVQRIVVVLRIALVDGRHRIGTGCKQQRQQRQQRNRMMHLLAVGVAVAEIVEADRRMKR